MPDYRRGPRKNQESYLALRDEQASIGLNPDQEKYLAAFVLHVLEHEMALYLASMGGGKGLRVRVFNGDDKYEDTLALSEDFGPVFDAYCKALGGQDTYRARVAALNALNAHAAARAAKEGKA